MATREEREAERAALMAARDAERAERDQRREAQRAELAAQRESDADDRDNSRAAERDAREQRRNVDAEDRSNAGDDFAQFDISRGAGAMRNLGAGSDQVEVRGDAALTQVRVTFTSSEVGNANPNDSNTMANQDGGLAVRVQAEDANGNLTGIVSRFDDEGIEFTTRGDVKFDVRDLVSGAQRGDMFDVVRLGTIGNDTIDETGETEAYYVNAGMGNDVVTGGSGNDFLVGGGGNDSLTGAAGNDSFIGGGGVDTISGGEGVDSALFNIATDGADQVNLGTGLDVVRNSAAAGTGPSQIRLTFTSAEVGNGLATDGVTGTNQDGGLAVRYQAEDANGNLTGAVARFDDEGVSFVAAAGQTFDVRDLTSGVARGDQFDVVRLGTSGGDLIDDSAGTARYYTNGGGGDDAIFGGAASDFLVGGAGNDSLDGRGGNDTFIGGGGADLFVFTGTPGNDRIDDFMSGTDKIDLRSYGISSDNITTTTSGNQRIVSVDSNRDGTADFTITLVGANEASPPPPAPLASDYLL